MTPDSFSIRVEQLTCTFPGKRRGAPPVIANANISCEVGRGEIFGLLGPNGAGKTTLVCQLMGLLQPASGRVWLEGIDVLREPEKVKRLVGFLPQTGLPMRSLEVEKALRFTGRLRGHGDKEARDQAHRLIEEFGMGEYAGRYIHKLSGGMLRLTNFAMALMGRPKVLILDEPTNELDPHKRRMVWDYLARLNRETGTTCILVTHNVLEAEKVIGRVAVMRGGKIVASGTPAELKQRVGGKVRMEFQVRAGEIAPPVAFSRLAALGKMDQPGHNKYRLYLPPEQVAAATALVIAEFGLASIEDLRLAPPSLEDIYLELDQGQGQAKSNRPEAGLSLVN